MPSRNWWYAWQDWEPASLQEDLHALAALGLDHVRIQCLWPMFQPSPSAVSATALKRLSELHDLADRAGLNVVTTVLDGWLSGFDFRPAWATDRNIFTDPGLIRAQKLLLREVGAVLQEHPRSIGLDVGNEINVLAEETPANSVAPGGVDAWAAHILDEARAAHPTVPIMFGVDNRPLTEPDSALSITGAATAGDISCVHAWPYFSGALKRFGHRHPGSYAIADYMTQLFRAHHRDPNRPVWVQEFGLAPEWVPALDHEDFVESQVRATVGIDGLWGATWWASHDISTRFREFAPLEYEMGLLDADNRTKTPGRILAQVIAERRAAAAAGTLPEAPTRTEALTVPTVPHGLHDAEAFFAAYARGERLALVRSDRADDRTHLLARGISSVRTTRSPRTTPTLNPSTAGVPS
ncbi:MAG: cellulase family glycosylhydrolase [Brachybacterium sp.]|nr:cellulase family glycosylhydrolase [Brachybacterium sp.]